MRDPGTSAIDALSPGHYGAASTGVTLAPATIAAAWNVQGNPVRPMFAAAMRRLFDIALPALPNTTVKTDPLTALWLGPASWLLLAGGPSPLVDFIAKRDALNAQGGALFDVTSSRVAWTLSGDRAADVLASGCPLDFHPREFRAGGCAQSVFGHINVLIEKRDEAPAFTLLVARSFARDAGHALGRAAAQYGCDVMPPSPYR